MARWVVGVPTLAWVPAVLWVGCIVGLMSMAGCERRAPAPSLLTVPADPGATDFDPRELAGDVLVKYEALPSDEQTNIKKLTRVASRAMVIRAAWAHRRLNEGETDVDLGPFVDELLSLPDPKPARVDGATDWDEQDRTLRQIGATQTLAHAWVRGVPRPERSAELEERATAVLRVSDDEIERVMAICLLWAMKEVAPARGLSPAGAEALERAIRDDAMIATVARRMLQRFGVEREALSRDFGEPPAEDGG